MTKRNKRGFTLIELLVVVAILGLLATIVAVSLTSARARARDARRVSDVRQLELALELYYAAHEEYPDAVVSAGEDIAELAGQGFLNMSSFQQIQILAKYIAMRLAQTLLWHQANKDSIITLALSLRILTVIS